MRAADGTIKWQFAHPGSSELTGWPVVTAGGVIYVTEQGDGKLYAYKDNGSSASLLWEFQLGHSGIGMTSPNVGPDGTLYVAPSFGASTPQTLYALAPATQTGTITGLVTDSLSNAPLADVRVSAASRAETQTDNDGHYTLMNVPAGTSVVSASKLGFVRQIRTTDLLAGQTVSLNFALIPVILNPATLPDGVDCGGPGSQWCGQLAGRFLHSATGRRLDRTALPRRGAHLGCCSG